MVYVKTVCVGRYAIPGPDGQLEPGHRMINWVWYCSSDDQSEEHTALMTDRHGKLHHFNLPIDGMRGEVWFPQVEKAQMSLPPQFSELVSLTADPFIQSITDVLPSKMTFFGGKVLLVGDAVATFRRVPMLFVLMCALLRANDTVSDRLSDP